MTIQTNSPTTAASRTGHQNPPYPTIEPPPHMPPPPPFIMVPFCAEAPPTAVKDEVAIAMAIKVFKSSSAGRICLDRCLGTG
jgi:hypothetical protein